MQELGVAESAGGIAGAGEGLELARIFLGPQTWPQSLENEARGKTRLGNSGDLHLSVHVSSVGREAGESARVGWDHGVVNTGHV